MTLNFELETRIEKSDLDRRLRSESLDGQLQGGEHCFREALHWYRLNVGYTNPLNFGEVHAELDLIKSQMRSGSDNLVRNAFRGRQLIFYGIGVGDTEVAFVDWALKDGENEVYVIGVDVNNDFIRNFEVALRNRTFEPDNPTLHFRGYHALFDQMQQEDLNLPGYANAHICLGGTIGNFHDQDAMMELFSNLAKPGETLVLGVQLDSNIDSLFEKYRNNPLFVDFVLNYVPEDKRKELRWSLDKERGLITATHKDVEVFRTTKYDTDKLQRLVTMHGFKFLHQVTDDYENSCLQVYERE